MAARTVRPGTPGPSAGIATTPTTHRAAARAWTGSHADPPASSGLAHTDPRRADYDGAVRRMGPSVAPGKEATASRVAGGQGNVVFPCPRAYLDECFPHLPTGGHGFFAGHFEGLPPGPDAGQRIPGRTKECLENGPASVPGGAGRTAHCVHCSADCRPPPALRFSRAAWPLPRGAGPPGVTGPTDPHAGLHHLVPGEPGERDRRVHLLRSADRQQSLWRAPPGGAARVGPPGQVRKPGWMIRCSR